MVTVFTGSSLVTVRISKPTPDASLGMLLVQREEGQPPEISAIQVGGLAQQSELWPGDVILTINGLKVLDDDDASKLIRKAETEVVIGVMRPNDPTPAAGSEQVDPLAKVVKWFDISKIFGCAEIRDKVGGKEGGRQAPAIK